MGQESQRQQSENTDNRTAQNQSQTAQGQEKRDCIKKQLQSTQWRDDR